MNHTVAQLRSIWNKEKKHYKKQEVGSGIQSFIKKMLESEDLFNLKEGRLSTKRENRKNEFIYEKRAKEGRRADFVIYIDSEIVIPMEVESFENIERGKKQLAQYQKDFDKKYGILTDGFIWRFYNNNLYREFNLSNILDDPPLFLEFWKEYIKPEFYYLSFFEAVGQSSLLKEIERLPVEENRQIFFEDITNLIRSFEKKLNIEGYFNGLEKREKEKKAIEITYAYIIQFILYKTLVDNDFNDFVVKYNENVNRIHEYISAERYKDILGIIDGMSSEISRNIYHPFAKEQEFITQKILQLYRSVENELSDVSPWLDIFVFIKKYNFANVKNEIFGYIYENYLKELYEDEKKGQYFTDPAVVNFMLEQIGYTPKNLKNTLYFDRNVSIIDPSCGSGTFLYSAVDRLIEATGYDTEKASRNLEKLISESVFGLDIAEFPLYLAEMNILMRMLPMIIHEKYNNPVDQKIKVFLTKDSVAEFTDTNIKNTLNDSDVEYHKNNGQLQLFQKIVSLSYQSFVREEKDIEEMKQSLENYKLHRRRFDFVIGNPPYVSYNECSKQHILFFNLMKKGEAKLNDVYGVNLHSIPDNRKKYSPKPNLYAFFIALGVALLKDNAKLCYIIPQTILIAGDLDVLRYHLAKFTTIEKIITFNGKMFIGRGIRQNKPVPTSSLIFVVRRKIPDKLHEVEIIHYKDPDDEIEKCLQNILDDKKISKKRILQNKLLQNVASWNFIKQDKIFLDFYDDYKKNSEDISIYYNHAWAEQKFKSKFYFDIGFSLMPKEVKKNEDSIELYELLDFKTFYGYSRFIPTVYYPKDKTKIKLTQNNQGYITLEQKYKIVWSIKNPDRFCFTDHPIIFYMGKASIICSNRKDEIVYLLSLLNSPTIKLVLAASCKSENEKEYLIPIKAIKEFVRVPKISEDNQHIKEEIIKRTEEMIALEEKTLSDVVDFSSVMVQKFDDVAVQGSNLILSKGDKKTKLKIRGKTGIVEQAIGLEFSNNKLKLEDHKISLSELKSMPMIDFDKQKAIKDYIDDLVFALYFGINLPTVSFSAAKQIKKICYKDKFYELLIEHTKEVLGKGKGL
ncbi:MAG: Eco57I restriction-modification methylase domain-containing protein [candidate division Zixibacteria bacterium]|nr:Eco57I restriction-modification methylase domain-containing protein [candidate division Zixibacteria bacterium]